MARLPIFRRPAPGILLVLVWIIVWGCDDSGAAFKARLPGTWASDHPRYEGCRMTLDPARMVFETAEGALKTFAISEIRYTLDKHGHLLQLQMMESGEPAFVMSFYLEPRPDGDRLIFKNQSDVVWRRAPNP